MASPGFRQALAAHQAVTPAQRLHPGITEAVERQTKAMRELSRRAFPETEAAVDDVPVPINAAHLQRRREADGRMGGPEARRASLSLGQARTSLRWCASIASRSVAAVKPRTCGLSGWSRT